MPRTPSAHGSSGSYKRGFRCGECRAGHRDRMRAYVKMVKERDGVTPTQKYRPAGSAKRCADCGVELRARAASVYCRACGQAARERLRRANVRRRAAERRLAIAAQGTTGGRLIWVQGACCVCGTSFLSPGLASRYCSRDCRATARALTNWIDFSVRLLIYRQDGWNCQICGGRVDMHAPVLSDWHPTLDHILPRSRGGTDDPTNLRTAHRWCNSVRGDETYYTDADLRVGVANG